MSHICRECGKLDEGQWEPITKARLETTQRCHTCDFWHGKIAIKDREDVARINGTHYQVGDENERGFRGFNGARFHIRWNDGREVVTTNLWFQGTIPKWALNQLPDNASFIKEPK